MSTESQGFLPRLLDPIERFSELLFGLIMVLSFTGSLSAAEAGRSEVRTMLIGAFGCNLAWGIVDAVMYLMGTYTERKRSASVLRAVRAARDPETAHRLIADALPPVVASALPASALESVRRDLLRLPASAEELRLGKHHLASALAVFAWVVIGTSPVLIPFLFVTDTFLALRLSNAVAIVMLFALGTSLGHYAGLRAWRVGLAMVLIGGLLVAITIALGG